MQVPDPQSTNWPVAGASGPVTITVSRIAKPGKEREFEEWMAGVCTVASKFEGHRGFTVLRPANQRREYILIFRFDSVEHLEIWNHSPERNDWISRAKPLTVGDPRVELTTGLEHWFTLPDASVQPPRHKMALLTWVAVFPIILLFSIVVLPYLAVLPWPLPTMIMSATLVLLMTYLVMPRVARLFAWWLMPR